MNRWKSLRKSMRMIMERKPPVPLKGELRSNLLFEFGQSSYYKQIIFLIILIFGKVDKYNDFKVQGSKVPLGI